METNAFMNHTIHRLLEVMITTYQTSYSLSSSVAILSLANRTREVLERINPSAINVNEIDSLAESLKLVHKNNSADSSITLPIILFLVKYSSPLENIAVETPASIDLPNSSLQGNSSFQSNAEAKKNERSSSLEKPYPLINSDSLIASIARALQLKFCTWFVISIFFGAAAIFIAPTMAWKMEREIFLKTYNMFKNELLIPAVEADKLLPEDFYSNPLLNDNVYLGTFGQFYSIGYRALLITPFIILTFSCLIIAIMHLRKFFYYKDLSLQLKLSAQLPSVPRKK